MNKFVQVPFPFGTEMLPYPNVGQHLEIEALKQQLTGGEYYKLATISGKRNSFNLNLVDAIAVFGTMIKDRTKFEKHYKADSLIDMDLFQAKEVSKLYVEHYKPFYDKISKELFSEDYAPIPAEKGEEDVKVTEQK